MSKPKELKGAPSIKDMHWQQSGYTTIKTNAGQYTFKGTSEEEIKAHLEEQYAESNRHLRLYSALKSYLDGETESHPDAIR